MTWRAAGATGWPLPSVPLAKATELAAEAADVSVAALADAEAALRVHKSLALYELLEKKLIPVLTAMEAAGVWWTGKISRPCPSSSRAGWREIEAQIHKLAGAEFNVGSPKQLGEVLFETMKLPGGKKGKTGAWGTDSSVLEGLAEQGALIAQRVMDWRQLAKLKSTYADALVGADRRQNRARAYEFPDGGDGDGADFLHRSEFAEYSDPDRGRRRASARRLSRHRGIV